MSDLEQEINTNMPISIKKRYLFFGADKDGIQILMPDGIYTRKDGLRFVIKDGIYFPNIFSKYSFRPGSIGDFELDKNDNKIILNKGILIKNKDVLIKNEKEP